MLTLGDAGWRVHGTPYYLCNFSAYLKIFPNQQLLVFKKKNSVLFLPLHVKRKPTIPLYPNIPIYVALFHKVNVAGFFPFPEHTRSPFASGTLLKKSRFFLKLAPVPSCCWPHNAGPEGSVPSRTSLWVSHCPHSPLWILGVFWSATLISIFRAGECLCRSNTPLESFHRRLSLPLSPPTPQRQRTPAMGENSTTVPPGDRCGELQSQPLCTPTTA